MSVVWILFVCSIIVLPGIALLAFRWALRQGEFDNLQKTALSIFDEDEPVGRMTDHFPQSGSGADAHSGLPTAAQSGTGQTNHAKTVHAKHS